RRDKWKPNTHSRICQVHFDEDQFERGRQDGKIFLKSSAIPTLFPHSKQKKERKPPKPREPLPAKSHVRAKDTEASISLLTCPAVPAPLTDSTQEDQQDGCHHQNGDPSLLGASSAVNGVAGDTAVFSGHLPRTPQLVLPNSMEIEDAQTLLSSLTCPVVPAPLTDSTQQDQQDDCHHQNGDPRLLGASSAVNGVARDTAVFSGHLPRAPQPVLPNNSMETEDAQASLSSLTCPAVPAPLTGGTQEDQQDDCHHQYGDPRLLGASSAVNGVARDTAVFSGHLPRTPQPVLPNDSMEIEDAQASLSSLTCPVVPAPLTDPTLEDLLDDCHLQNDSPNSFSTFQVGQCEEVTQLKQRVAELDQKVAEHKRKVNNLQKRNNVLLREKKNTAEGLQTVFTEDQIRALGRKSNCGSPWSSATIKKSLQLHFACIKFEPGVLCEVFDLMKCKVAAFKPQERKCVLMLDEMQLQDKLEYDKLKQRLVLKILLQLTKYLVPRSLL
ncbi:uncharacterized protein LOC115310440, partial [Ixodes scapularis]|uniref:uncharacterized protein LOC115310440 n=1 Tax=Ixodes scapularis TaxID=6945 RepID=UPI001A9F3048